MSYFKAERGAPPTPAWNDFWWLAELCPPTHRFYIGKAFFKKMKARGGVKVRPCPHRSTQVYRYKQGRWVGEYDKIHTPFQYFDIVFHPIFLVHIVSPFEDRGHTIFASSFMDCNPWRRTLRTLAAVCKTVHQIKCFHHKGATRLSLDFATIDCQLTWLPFQKQICVDELVHTLMVLTGRQ